jgi:transcription elongation factor GreA
MTGQREVPITRNGLQEVKRELDELVNVRRPEIVSKIKAAREHGDLSENFEYHAARNEQSFLETRILELEAIVKNHVVIESTASGGEVGLLSTVTLQEEGQPEERYTIVGPAEADPANGRVSFESAIGKALMGHRVGQEVDVQTPTGGSYTVRIVRVE